MRGGSTVSKGPDTAETGLYEGDARPATNVLVAADDDTATAGGECAEEDRCLVVINEGGESGDARGAPGPTRAVLGDVVPNATGTCFGEKAGDDVCLAEVPRLEAYPFFR